MHNIKLPKRKLQVRMTVIFSGMLIGGGDGSYKPAPSKVKAISELNHCTTVSKVRSLLGLLNSFKNFILDLTPLLQPIRSLLRKDTLFQWTEQCEQECREIKEIISGPLGLKPFVPGWLTQLFVDYSGQGMGFALTQVNKNNPNEKRLIWMDSTKLTPSQE